MTIGSHGSHAWLSLISLALMDHTRGYLSSHWLSRFTHVAISHLIGSHGWHAWLALESLTVMIHDISWLKHHVLYLVLSNSTSSSSDGRKDLCWLRRKTEGGMARYKMQLPRYFTAQHIRQQHTLHTICTNTTLYCTPCATQGQHKAIYYDVVMGCDVMWCDVMWCDVDVDVDVARCCMMWCDVDVDVGVLDRSLDCSTASST